MRNKSRTFSAFWERSRSFKSWKLRFPSTQTWIHSQSFAFNSMFLCVLIRSLVSSALLQVWFDLLQLLFNLSNVHCFFERTVFNCRLPYHSHKITKAWSTWPFGKRHFLVELSVCRFQYFCTLEAVSVCNEIQRRAQLSCRKLALSDWMIPLLPFFGFNNFLEGLGNVIDVLFGLNGHFLKLFLSGIELTGWEGD